ncbi:MAG: carboxylesterase/lipase family protein [Pseudomonadales bacterium]
MTAAKATRIIKTGLVLAVMTSCLTACGGSQAPSTAKGSRVILDSGEIIGFDKTDDTYAWLGIPYAAPPLADLRWRAPQPVESWQGVKNTVEFGSACIQPPNPIAGSNAAKSEFVVGSEDCLTVNVFAPKAALAAEQNLPVMFWIHGGANIVGSAQQTDGAKMAGSQNVVVVTINYRLGLLGWFRHAALRPAGSSLADQSGNYGSLDIIAALQWVQRNVSAFGGNPNQVTVFGESAGGRNTWSMVQSPLAKDLFHGAIVQSGSLRIMDPVKAEGLDPDATDYPVYQNNSAELVPKLVQNYSALTRSELAAKLRDKTPDELFNSVKTHPQGLYEQPRLFLDGHVFIEPALELFKDPSKYNAMPIMTGANRDENKLFMQFDPEWVDMRLGFLPKVKDAHKYNSASALGADTWRVLTVDKPAEIITKHGGQAVYAYRFDFDDMISWPLDFPVLMGAAHAMELPFVFGGHDKLPWKWLFKKPNARVELSQKMMNYWGEFARTGKPGHGGADGQDQWTPWQPHGKQLMLFDVDDDGGVRMADEAMDLATIKQRLARQEGFNQKEKCDAYLFLFLNGYQTPIGYDEQEFLNFADGGCAVN